MERELQKIFNYAEWRNFLKAVDKAKKSCEAAGEELSNHFVGFNKMVEKEEWVLSIMKQTNKQEAAFFFKQWGTWGSDGIKRNKKLNGKKLNGKIYQTMPIIT